jgi:hypothetical protein
MKPLDVKALGAALALAGLMTASAYVNAENNRKAIVEGELVQQGEVTSSSTYWFAKTTTAMA